MRAQCSFGECERKHCSGGLCNSHYMQRKRGRPLTPIVPGRPYRPSRLRDEEGRKQCGQCLIWRAESEFRSSRMHADRLQSHCTLCVAANQRKRLYGIDSERFESMLREQEGLCAICGRELGLVPGGMCVDHDHSCCPKQRSCGNCVRGVLCRQCNTGLGNFRDSPGLLEAAVDYLAAWAA